MILVILIALGEIRYLELIIAIMFQNNLVREQKRQYNTPTDGY